MTELLARVRAADPAAALDQLVSDAELAAWCDAGLHQVLSVPSPLADVRPDATAPDDARPAPVGVLPRQRRPAAWAHRRREIGRPAAGSRRRAPVSARRWWVPAAGVAAAVALAVSLGLPGRTATAVAATPSVLKYTQVASTSRAEAQAIAQECLERQRSARAVPAAFTVRWSEWSLATRVAGRQVTSAVVPVQVSLTRRSDGSAELVRRTSAPQFPDRASRERWVDDGRPAAQPVTVGHERWAPGGFSPDASALPDDPDRLLPALAEGHPIEQLGDAEVLVAIADAYRSARLSPAQQAALFSFAASRAGLEPFGQVTDRAGRVGYALSVESDYSGLPTRYTAIFDPATGRLLDLEQTLTRSAGSLGVRVPATIGYTVFE
jgi:hypothetical protein